ncbi:uncharacterized protein FA14DRAFT_114139, partial [Meira miltonrushii]
VRTFTDHAQLDIPYAILCPVYFLRYPNELASHVVSVDVLARQIISRPRIRQTLILKKGTLPKWAPSGILRNAESWVLEESEVELDSPFSASDQRTDGEGRKMKCWTRNLDHTTVMAVTENLTFTEQLPASIDKEDAPISTSRLDSTHDVESSMGFTLLQSRIEKFGYQRVRTHVDTSRKGLWMTYSRFLQQRLQEGRINALVVN